MSRRTRRVRIAFVIGTMVLGVSVLSFVLTALQSRSLERNGVHTVGTVTAVDGGGGGGYTIEVSYVAAGRTIDQPVAETIFGHQYRVGETVPVVYSRTDPATMTLSGQDNPSATRIALGSAGLGLGLGCLLVTAIIWTGIRRTRRGLDGSGPWAAVTVRHVETRTIALLDPATGRLLTLQRGPKALWLDAWEGSSVHIAATRNPREVLVKLPKSWGPAFLRVMKVKA